MIIQFLDEIKEHFASVYPREGCGVIVVVAGKRKWIPCENVARKEEDFCFDSREYFHIARTADILAIVHNHPDASNEPSSADVANCNSLGVPYYIFSYPEMDLNIVNPEYNRTELMGRVYEFGVKDCFEAMRDCYSEMFEIELPHRLPYEDDWWEKGLDYFSEEHIATWGFELVEKEKMERGDLLIFTVDANVGNHCGVYLGNDCFYHHAVNRLSCRENLYSLWGKYLTGVYRYVA